MPFPKRKTSDPTWLQTLSETLQVCDTGRTDSIWAENESFESVVWSSGIMWQRAAMVF